MATSYGVATPPLRGDEQVRSFNPPRIMTTGEIAGLAGGSAAPLASLAVTGNATVGGTLGVTGRITATSITSAANLILSGASTSNFIAMRSSPAGSNLFVVGFSPNLIQANSTLWLNPPGTWVGNTTTGGIIENISMTGTANNAYYNLLQITDTVNDPGSQGSVVLGTSLIVGGAGSIGAKTSFQGNLTVSSASGNTTGAGGAYVGGQFAVTATTNDNGTAGFQNGRGALYGINPTAHIGPSATFFADMMGAEFDISAEAGSSVENKFGISIVQTPGDQVQGSANDIGIVVANGAAIGSGSTKTSGWKYGLSFGSNQGQWSISPTGTIIGGLSQAAAMTAAYGIDWSGVTFATAFLKSTGFLVSGIGAVTAPSIDNGTTGLTVFATGAKGVFFGGTPIVKPTGVAVTAAGIHAALVSLNLIAA